MKFNRGFGAICRLHLQPQREAKQESKNQQVLGLLPVTAAC
jgi:hypothetical protein